MKTRVDNQPRFAHAGGRNKRNKKIKPPSMKEAIHDAQPELDRPEQERNVTTVQTIEEGHRDILHTPTDSQLRSEHQGKGLSRKGRESINPNLATRRYCLFSLALKRNCV